MLRHILLAASVLAQMSLPVSIPIPSALSATAEILVIHPGSGEPLDLTVLAENLDPLEVGESVATKTLKFEINSPNGQFVGGEGYVGVTLIQGGGMMPLISGAHGDFLSVNTALFLLPNIYLSQGGDIVEFTISPAYAGATVLVQGIVFSLLADDGIAALTEAYEIRFGQ